MTAQFRCPDCGAVPVGRHADVCWRREEPVPVAQTETYRDVPSKESFERAFGAAGIRMTDCTFDEGCTFTIEGTGISVPIPPGVYNTSPRR